MKKGLLFVLCFALMLTTGCGSSKDQHASSQVSTPESSAGAESAASVSSAAASGSAASSGPQEASDDYPYDIAADRKNFDPNKIDMENGICQ